MKILIFRKIDLFFVSFLTILNGCALFPFESTPEEIDPVAQAALGYRSPASLQSQEGEEDVQGLYDDHDLILGMRMNDVLSIWGQPREIETAGDPRFGNQKWTYWEGISKRYQIQSNRVVYLESGKVAGWETKK
jgi:hypothetical protein